MRWLAIRPRIATHPAAAAATATAPVHCATRAGAVVSRRAASMRGEVSHVRRWILVVVGVAVLVLAGRTLWIGANSPSASWFGALVSHGPRTTRDVALTFDDGPNATATLAVRDLLDQAGVKGA